MFSFLRQLSTWYCSHLLLSAVLLAARRPPLSINIPCPHGAQQHANDAVKGRDRQADGRTDNVTNQQDSERTNSKNPNIWTQWPVYIWKVLTKLLTENLRQPCSKNYTTKHLTFNNLYFVHDTADRHRQTDRLTKYNWQTQLIEI